MRAPSEKKLLEAFRDLDRKQAKLIRAFAKAEDDPEELEELVEKVPETERYVRSLYSSPYRSGIWRVTVALHAINEIVGGYGVEGLGPGRSGDFALPYEYINMGDTYITTLIYDRDKDRLFIGDWGSIVEAKGDEWEENPQPKLRREKRVDVSGEVYTYVRPLKKFSKKQRKTKKVSKRKRNPVSVRKLVSDALK